MARKTPQHRKPSNACARVAKGTPTTTFGLTYDGVAAGAVLQHDGGTVDGFAGGLRLAFYFSHVIAGVQQFIRSKSPWKDFNFDAGNNEDYLIFQMAVPTGLLATDGKTEKLFREAVFGNVGTLVAFRIGYTDAEVMTKEFGKTIPATALADLNQYEAVVKLLVSGTNREPFRAQMLPPLENRVGRRDKLIALSRERFAMPRAKIEAKLGR